MRKTVSNLQNQLDQIQNTKSQLEKEKSQLEREKLQLQKEKLELEKKYCRGVWKDGRCITTTCVDSDVNEKPKDIYIKGYVIYTDENGVSTRINDECTGTLNQVNEMWCYESPLGTGNYVPGRRVYDCPKGCFDGACLLK